MKTQVYLGHVYFNELICRSNKVENGALVPLLFSTSLTVFAIPEWTNFKASERLANFNLLTFHSWTQRIHSAGIQNVANQ